MPAAVFYPMPHIPATSPLVCKNYRGTVMAAPLNLAIRRFAPRSRCMPTANAHPITAVWPRPYGFPNERPTYVEYDKDPKYLILNR